MVLPGGTTDEFSEDCRWPIEDLSQSAPHSVHDAHFSYNLEDIDRVSEELGIPWELSKDQPFASSTIYIGFLWDLEAHTVTLSASKRDKYSGAINNWLARPRHNLKHVQELYGKLLHAASVLPQGRAHLTGLESMLASCAKHPFMLHCPDKDIERDLHWWLDRILSGSVTCPIHIPTSLHNMDAFSDASSGIGIGIVISIRWRSWRL